MKSLRENSFTRYLLYAIGEIVLVVIGILIALQVNNWNENRKSKAEREELISSLISDLKASRDRLSVMKQENEKSIARTNRFLALSYQDDQEVSIDSLKYYFSGAFNFPYFEPILTSYNQAISSGKISLINNKKFLDGMSQFLISYERFNQEAALSGHIFYMGSIWEVRKKVGNLVALAGEARSRNGRRKIEPDAYKLSDSEYRALIKQPEIFAAVDNMQTVFYNIDESFQDMDENAKKIIAQLELLK